MADGEEHLSGTAYENAMWRGGVNVKLETVASSVIEIRDTVKTLGAKLETIQLTLQSQVTKMVIIGGFIVWLGSAGIAIAVKFFMK